MTIEICIDAQKGQDCLEFSKVGSGFSRAWQFDSLRSINKAKSTTYPSNQTSVDPAGHGPYYVNQSAHGLLV
mgnify:CR=1 FL=1